MWLHRSEGLESLSFRFDPRFAGAAAAVVLLLVAGVGAVLGVLAQRQVESRRVGDLEERVASLRSRQAHVATLAARLDSVESAYRRMRTMLGTDAGESAGPELPPSASGGDVPPRVAGGEGSLPAGWPLARPGFVTRRFLSGGVASGHPGLDVAVPTGSYVRAVAAGTVREAGRDSVYGRFLRLVHEDGTRTVYGHASHLFVRAGERVERGQVIALSGNSGRSTAPHLHIEVRRSGRRIDPLRYLRSLGGGPAGADSSDVTRAGLSRTGRLQDREDEERYDVR